MRVEVSPPDVDHDNQRYKKGLGISCPTVDAGSTGLISRQKRMKGTALIKQASTVACSGQYNSQSMIFTLRVGGSAARKTVAQMIEQLLRY